MRQLIVDLKAEYPDFSLREIAEICYVQFDRRPSHNTIKQVLADGPTPLRTTRQYPLYADIPDPAERRVAVIRLHAQGWSVTSIAAYLGVARKTIYQILKRLSSKKGYAVWRTSRMPIRIGSLRWIYVPATPSANCKRTRGSGEYRMHGALLQLGIRLSPRTRCADHGRESAVVWADQTRHREERAEIPSVYGTISP